MVRSRENHKNKNAPLKGFCHTHDQRTADYVCEACRIFYCDRCLAERNLVAMKCMFCDAICTNLKRANYVRENKKTLKIGLAAGDLKRSFGIREYSFYVMACALGAVYLSNPYNYLVSLLLLSGVLIHRMRSIFENKSASPWFDFEIEDWTNLFKSTAAALIVVAALLAPVVATAKLCLSGMPNLNAALSSDNPNAGYEANREKIKTEISLLFTLNWYSFEAEQKRKYEKAREKAAQSGALYGNCLATGGQIDLSSRRTPDVQRMVNCGSPLPVIGSFNEMQMAEMRYNFWWTKLFAILCVATLFAGIFYLPLGFGNIAVSENFKEALNFSHWSGLSKNLTEDYGRVFFYWLCFLILIAVTICLEIRLKEGSFQDPFPRPQSFFYTSMQFSFAAWRFYLLYVLTTMLGKMLYENRLLVKR